MIQSPYPSQSLNDLKEVTYISFLDMARWIAAAIVVFGHVRNPLFLGYNDLVNQDQTIFVKIWFFVSGWFAEAVIVFFVLSGFLVGGLGCAKFARGTFSASKYFIDRASRIYAAFLPALLLTVVLDLLGSNLFEATGFYNHTQPMIAQKVASASFVSTIYDPEVFLMNVGLLQTFLVPPYGSNQPLWTISAEFWFYVVFGLAVLVAGSKTYFRQVLNLCAILLVFLVLGWQFPLYLGLWLLGLGTAFVAWRNVERPIVAVFVFLSILVLVRLRQDIFEQSFVMRNSKDYLVALSFAWVLVSMRRVKFKPLAAMARFNRFMADFSYSLYLIHFPLMLFLLGAFHATGYFDGIAKGYTATSGEGLFLYGAVIVIVYVTAWIFAQATEMQTWKIRRALKRRFVKSEPVSPPSQ